MASVLQKSYLSNLCTLIVTRGIRSFHVDAEKLFAELLSGLKSVRVICILCSDLQQLPHNMGHLIHLRYLYLDNYDEGWWGDPDSLGRLYQLQYADNGAESLILPAIEKLTRFQELDCFVIEEGRKIGELKNLNQLGGSLALENLENVHTKKEALEAELSKKMHIRHLSLECKDSHTSPEVAEQVLEGLRPPACIKSLIIDGYSGVNTPTWMVNEIRCKDSHTSPEVAEEVLEDAVEEIGSGFYGTGDAKGFPCLETLDFVRMPQLVVWSGIGEDPVFLFPVLPKLEQVPRMDLPSLTELNTSYMHLLLHPENISSLKALFISACEELQSLPVLPPSHKSSYYVKMLILTIYL